MNFSELKKVHMTGIKGVGMTALALCLQDLGVNVTGSDTKELFVTDKLLNKRGIKWEAGISSKHVGKDIDLLITTAAHGGLENEEVKKAKQLKIPVLTYAQALAELSFSKETICVCGVGGKTSTCSMLSVVMDTAKLAPSFVVGVGNIFPLGISGRYSKNGRDFICESDEYVVSPGVDNRPKFSLLKPKIIVATNIEYDHPDVYENFEKTKEAFMKFFQSLHKYGSLIVDADNENTMEVAKNSGVKFVSYGFNKDADYKIKNVKFSQEKISFDLAVKKSEKKVAKIQINVPGEYNIRNAAAAFAVGDLLKIDWELLKAGLNRYLGCRRRFEDMGIFYGARFYDDYAHHPGEILETIKAARKWFPKKRLVVIFQPHTYSRTKALFESFSESFKSADVVAIMDIYSSAREKADNSISSELLVNKIKENNKDVYYIGEQPRTLKWIESNVKENDVVLTMGAGDIFHLYGEMKKKSFK